MWLCVVDCTFDKFQSIVESRNFKFLGTRGFISNFSCSNYC